MAITDKEQGVWILDEVYNKQMEGGIWSYDGRGELFNWGKNHYGQLGLNTNSSPANEGRSSPVQIPGTTWTALPRGVGGSQGNFGMATKSDGSLWAWGYGDKGVLGQNSVTSLSSPTQIPGTTWSQDPSKIDKSKGASVIKTDGTLWSWGYSWQGQAGNNVGLIHYSSPVQCPGTTWSKLGSGGTTRVAIKTDGTLWTWGGNQYGSQGHNNRTNQSSPIQVPGSTWNDVSGAKNSVIATKSDGTLWMWGANSDAGGYAGGGLGQNNKTDYSSPVQVPGTTWSTEDLKIATNFYASVAIKTDGTLWSWGSNYYGNLGQNGEPSNQFSSPVQIPGTTWSKVSTFAETGFFSLKTDGTMWSWGRGASGVLGQGTDADVKSPKQIGTETNWLQVSGEAYVGRAIRLL